MVEAIGKKKTRQDKVELQPEKRKKVQEKNKEDDFSLTNINVEEYKADPEKFEEEFNATKPVGTQVFIQFQDADNKTVGQQISVDSYTGKGDLNAVLMQILEDNNMLPDDEYGTVQ